MIKYYVTEKHKVNEISAAKPGCWARAWNPSQEEMLRLMYLSGIDMDDIQAAIDPEEKNRVEINDDYTMVIIDVPAEDMHNDEPYYTTIPLGIFLTSEMFVTVSSRYSPIMDSFTSGRIKNFSTRKKMRFIYQIILQASLAFQKALREIDHQRREIEENLSSSTGEDELIRLHEMESSLVYFTTSLDGNSNVLNRLSRYEKLEQFKEDDELLGDVIIENQQAREMSDIYRNIIDSTRDLVSTLLDKRLNNVMKVLTSATLVMAVPTVISGLYGMNVNRGGMPFAHMLNGFGLICALIVIICVLLFIHLKKKDML